MNTLRAALLLLSVMPLASALAGEDEPLSKPLPGRDVVRPMKPDWCDDVEVESWLANSPERAADVVERNIHNRWDEKALSYVAQAACVLPNDEAMQRKVSGWRQQYINLVGITEAEDREAMKVRGARDLDGQRKAWCGPLKEAEAEAGPDAKALGRSFAMGTGCEADNMGEMARWIRADYGASELGWWLDRRAEVDSEVVRAVYVLRCLRLLRNDEDMPNPKDDDVMAAYAVCGPDARRLDRSKLEQELADPSKGWTPFSRVKAVETWSFAKVVADSLTAAFKAKAAKDDAFQKLLFDGPEQGWAAWEKAYEANKEGFEAARAYEKAFYGPSKKARLGCGEKLRKNWNGYLKSRAPKTRDEARAAALDDMGGVMLEALTLCDALEGRLQVAKTEVELLEGEKSGRPPPRRGPRLAAYASAIRALNEILSDRDKFPVKGFFPRVEAPRELELKDGAYSAYANKVAFGDDAQGTVQSLKKDGDMVQVTFKPVTTMVLNRQCNQTNRIRSISADGKINYDYDCFIGKPAKLPVTNKEKPVAVPAVVADGLKPGVVATVSANFRDEPEKMRDGLPREVWVGDKLVVFYGAPL